MSGPRGTLTRLCGLALALVLGAGPGGASAQTGGEDFYRNKTIRILVGAAGGGFDVYARTLARHLGPHIPGSPAVIVEVVAGAGGLVAANHLYRIARPDGLTIGHFSGDLLFGQVLGRPGVEFDARRFEYVGAAGNEQIVCAFSKSSGITSVDRWISARAPVKLGGVAPGTNGDSATRILKATLPLPIQLVSGYKGTTAIRLAVETGEVAGACFNWVSMRTAWWHALETGEVVPVLQLAPRPQPDLPSVPLAIDLARTDDARQIIRTAIHSASALARPYALPPETPRERVHILRRAFLATLADPEFLADAKRSRLGVSPAPGEEIERLVADLFTIDPATIARLRAILFD